MQKIQFDRLHRNHPGASLIFIRACLAAGDVDPTVDGVYDVELTVQGKEVDFLKFCQSFEKHWDDEVNEAALKKLEELAGFKELRDKLEEIERAASVKCEELLAEFHSKQPV